TVSPPNRGNSSFIRQLFMGRYQLGLLERLTFEAPTRPPYQRFHQKLEAFLRNEVDPATIDRTGEYPKRVLDRLAEMGAFGMKIPREYGGLGFTHGEYMRAMELLGSHDANVTALLSAHQAIGVPQPVLLFGTEEQKQRWLPRCAAGAISAFALTEPAVGSDPARLGTLAIPTADGSSFELHGEKLWCTNGTIADVIVVMARNPETDRISTFIVDMKTEGVEVEHRCHFMGLRALANASVRFRGARIPRENLIGEEGDGLRIALATLNTGRLSLPAATSGMVKKCTEIVRKWSNARHQWGEAVGKHEAVAAMNARITTSAFAMESVAFAVGELADRDDMDIRLEAAAAKEWNTTRCWEVIDDTLQVRGGRGYETEQSLKNRGEPGIGIERALRDSRINRIFEGSNEIMHLFIAREGLDEHLSIAETLIDPKASIGQKLRILPRVAWFYLRWYPMLLVGWPLWPSFRRYGALAKHVRFASRATRRLARVLFHGMVVYRAGLERKQRFLFRAVDIALEIFVMTCSVRRAALLARSGAEHADSAEALANAIAHSSRDRITTLLSQFWRNNDVDNYEIGRSLLRGEFRWLETGILGIPYDEKDLTPPTMEEILDRKRSEAA
ncbi:MAG: acyl-CoA dehydrogenase family protein, partial [Myxococcales bacterium]|nr:acyl-CoA dehydrogenase family protein [Myxococcales bacterium]